MNFGKRDKRYIKAPYQTQRRPTTERRSSNVCRRLSLPTPTFYSRATTASTNSDIFVPESPQHEQEDHFWGPGQVIPHTTTYPSPHGSSPHSSPPFPHVPSSHGHFSHSLQDDSDLKSILQGLQNSVETNFQQIKKQLGDLEDRVAKVEGKQVELQNSPSSSSSSDTRKRRSPPELQNQLRRIHAALDEENQLRPDERIDSDHNKSVLQTITKEIGTEKYTEKQIKDGVRIYRKTMREASKGRPSPVKARVRIRSRQQRLFERRARGVRQKEQKHWKHVTADMMSEEEESGDGFIRHQPSWRSGVFNRFIEKIDHRLSKKGGKTVARRREYGDKCVRPIPTDIPDWMKESACSDNSASADGGLSDQQWK